MEDNYGLALWVAVWMAAIAAILYRQWREGSGGASLILAYALNLWLIHWLAAAIYLLPWYSNFNPEDVAAGFKQSTYAIVAFTVGSVLLAPLIMRLLRFPAEGGLLRKPDPNLPVVYIVIGLVCYLLLLPILGGIPTVTALISGGWNLLVVGLILKCWNAWRERRRKTFLQWLILTVCLPFLTIVTQGFIGYGTVAMMAVFAFVGNFYRPRWKAVAAGLLVGYLGLSLYVTYMRDRNAIRQVVWGGESYSARTEQLYSTFSEFEFFDPYDNAHLRRIDDRLNQNTLVGASVRYLDSGRQDFAGGETLWQAALALIPRVIWLDKPISAGSGDLVTRYTGITFAEGTSVGVGQVMEFYINFGTAGVIGGFLVMGVLVAIFDRAAGERLAAGDWQAFALWFLPGLSFMQAGGALVELTSSAGAAILLAVIIKRHVLSRMHGKRVAPAAIRFSAYFTLLRRYTTPKL